jgi:integrase
MARYGTFLYRRNGRYYARLRVPAALQMVVGKTELRVSLWTADYELARLRVHEAVLSWKRSFSRTGAMNPLQVYAGSPLLQGPGQLTLDSAARECGLTVPEMLQEIRNRRLDVRVAARGWWGCELADHELEFDSDGSFVVNSAEGHAHALVNGELYVRREELDVLSGDTLRACLFFRDKQRTQAVVVPYPGQEVSVQSLLVDKADAEAIRSSLASTIQPFMLKLAARSLPATTARSAAAPSTAAGPSASVPVEPVSRLIADFLADKNPNWSKATSIQMRGMCLVFVELMGDLNNVAVDKAVLHEYREQLMKLPRDLHLMRRRYPGRSLSDIARLAAAEPKMSSRRADQYVAKLGEALAWASRKGRIAANPAAGVLERRRSTKREQDERAPFSDANLQVIFSAEWFKTGRGDRTASGGHWRFQPHRYWLPLLALYTGARLNELAQLYLTDVRTSAAGTWYLDFNLEQRDKLEEPDKRLKTVNSERAVPLHSFVLQRGLIDYVNALRAAGHQRLFPELRFDPVKGYGKQAGQWFNERFLGNQLKIPRDGMQTFHSFRHNFTTALMHLANPAVGEFVVNQLTGHERGDTMSARRYAKDNLPDTLVQHIERLDFRLPPVAEFDIADGLLAVEAALARKAAVRARIP